MYVATGKSSCFEVAEWGVDHICGVDFDDLSDEAVAKS